MKKNKKPDLINFAELAKLAGVTAPAVSSFIRKQALAGSPVPVMPGANRREKLIDLNHPLVQGYLKNQTPQPGNRSGAKCATEAALEKLRAMTEKTELSAAVLRNKFIDRSFVAQYLDEFLKSEERELKAMVDRMLKQIAGEFGPVTSAKIKEIRKILERPAADALALTRHEVEKFRCGTEPRIMKPSGASGAKPPAKGKRNGKKNNSIPR
jgi:predicted transcriptional regulator